MIDVPPSIRVVKIGGSLLELTGLNRRIEDWRIRQSPARTIWLVGGGELVDKIRRQASREDHDAEVTHWACIEKMNHSSRRVARHFPNWKCINLLCRTELENHTADFILTPLEWTRRYGVHLPKTWEVTSDSIAATLAQWVDASELVLLKSTDPPPSGGIASAVATGFVDAFFLSALTNRQSQTGSVASLPVRTVNLRSPTFQQATWNVPDKPLAGS